MEARVTKGARVSARFSKSLARRRFRSFIFVIVAPYKFIMARRGKVVFGDPPATKTCPACLSDDLNPAASKCKHCGFNV
jgi:transposase